MRPLPSARPRFAPLFAAALLLSARWPGAALGAPGPCARAEVAVQVLGSGGPIADDNRASAGYLVWVQGRARLLVDAGGGVFLRFGEARASLDDLEAVLLTHLHADHSADLAALLKSGYFAERTRPLPIVGKGGGGDFPGGRPPEPRRTASCSRT